MRTRWLVGCFVVALGTALAWGQALWAESALALRPRVSFSSLSPT